MEWAEMYSLWCVGYLLYVERDDANGILYKSSLNKTYEHTNQILSLGFFVYVKSCDTHVVNYQIWWTLSFLSFSCLPNKRRGVTVRGRSAWLIVRPVSTSKWILRVALSTRACRKSIVLCRARHGTERKSFFFFSQDAVCVCVLPTGLGVVFNKIKWAYTYSMYSIVYTMNAKVLILLRHLYFKIVLCQFTIVKLLSWSKHV